jgi:formate dehydrogenase iron-sulfur subunit
MAKGFYTDTTLCIGCKACQVACHQWNELPAEEGGRRELTGQSYDNTGRLSALNWRHVKFIEQIPEDRSQEGFLQGSRWLMMSDTCKHCVHAGCLEACPTGAIVRTEFDSVFVRQEVCNGCRACLAACPFGVIDIGADGTAHKCTLCYDRLQHGMEPACAQACPTASIRFGEVSELMALAEQRVAELRGHGVPAYIYGKEDIVGGLNCFYLLVDEPEVYGLPSKPELPSAHVPEGFGLSAVTAALLALTGLVSFRKQRTSGPGGAGGPDRGGGGDGTSGPEGAGGPQAPAQARADPAPAAVGIEAVRGTERMLDHHRPKPPDTRPRRSLPILGQRPA